MSEGEHHRVAIVGCGRLGQQYAQAYQTYPDTEVVAIVEPNEDRLRLVGERFDVSALYSDVHGMLANEEPDVAAVVTPVRHSKEAVIACAEAGLKGVSVDKPIAGTLADADDMVEACASRGVVFGGGNLQRAMNAVQEAARRIHSGEFGTLQGAAVHGWGGEISGGGCQHICVLRLFSGAELTEVTAWGTPAEALEQEDDEGLIIHGQFSLSTGISCSVFGSPTPYRGVDVWTEEALIRWDWAPPEIYVGFDADGKRKQIDPGYAPYEWSEFSYLTGSIRSFLAAVETGSELWISGHDLRQALEAAIAAKHAALMGSKTLPLPLKDRSLRLLSRPYRWSGGDVTGKPQSLREAATGVRDS